MTDSSKVEIWVSMKLHIPHYDTNYYVCYSENPMTWQKFRQENTHIVMGVSNVGHGAGGTAIGFFTEEEWSKEQDTNSLLQDKVGFGFYANKETLLAIKRAIDFAVENYLG